MKWTVWNVYESVLRFFSFILQTWMPTHLDNSVPFGSKLVIDLFKYYITLNKENTSEYVLGTCM